MVGLRPSESEVSLGKDKENPSLPKAKRRAPILQDDKLHEPRTLLDGQAATSSKGGRLESTPMSSVKAMIAALEEKARYGGM
jgi:hypothetical protein